MPDSFDYQDILKYISLPNILDNLDVGVNINDAEGRFLFVNMVTVNWRNIPRKEFLKMNVHDFSPTMDSCVFDLACQEKRRVSRLQYYRNSQQVDGTPRMRITTATPILDDSGNVQYVLTMLQDISDFEETYHRLLADHKILDRYSMNPHTDVVESVGPGIVGQSAEFRQMLSIADQIAPLDSTVLLDGESGSGKVVVAHYIHNHSDRKDQPFITVNCAAFPENLIESELFGYERGSFTGANREGKAGLVESANGGTLFLDEINSLPLSVQGKVLRTIEDKSIQRVGSTHYKKVNFRLIAATNRSLEAMVRGGSFREDLYYRINVIPLTIPPIRNRKEDIVPLCLHYLHYFCQKYNLQKSFSDQVLEELNQYEWPGNVREIRNFVERIVVMTPSSVREIKHIPMGMLTSEEAERPQREGTLHGSLLADTNPRGYRSEELTRERVTAALSSCGGRRKDAARLLGISLRTLQYKIREYHLSSRCRYED